VRRQRRDTERRLLTQRTGQGSGRAQQLETAIPRIHDQARADWQRRHLREVLRLQLRRTRHQLGLRRLARHVVPDMRLNQLRQHLRALANEAQKEAG
jgi:hypothetical protein